MYELPAGVKPITHLIRWPEEALNQKQVAMAKDLARTMMEFQEK